MRKSAKTVTQRGQSKAPEDLARFIELVNRERPFERELPDLVDTFEDEIACLDLKDPSISLRDRWIKLCEEIATPLSPETRAYLGSAANFREFPRKYEQLKSAREVLAVIARRHSGRLVIPDPKMPGLEYSLSLSVNLAVNDKGVLTGSENPLLDALTGVQADRIRACSICGRIFWAPRINSECCSEPCRKTYNQRNSRKNRQFRRRKRR